MATNMPSVGQVLRLAGVDVPDADGDDLAVLLAEDLLDAPR